MFLLFLFSGPPGLAAPAGESTPPHHPLLIACMQVLQLSPIILVNFQQFRFFTSCRLIIITTPSRQPMRHSSTKKKDKAKVVASVWGEEFIQFLAALAILPRAIMNNRMSCTRMIVKRRMNSSYSSKSS